MRPRHIIDMLRKRGGSRCIAIGRLIQPDLDGALDAETASRVQAHLDACQRCGLTASDYRWLKAALADSAAAVPNEPLMDLQDLARQIGDERSSEPPRQ